ncbi:MAG: TetR family transcriptional regulator [Myxococcales bacterium]|nr:MAG: TetR family transcriptional regulator [Myxococcales bacterium]
MRHRRADIVDRALDLLGRVGLPDLTMRRLGTELGVQASAIYHHFPNKQALLGAVADELMARGGAVTPSDAEDWEDRVIALCVATRRALLAYPDGADLVATMWAFGLGGNAPYDALHRLLADAGLADETADTAARTLLHFVFGHAIGEQALDQATRVGAIAPSERAGTGFDAGLALIVAGVREHVDPPQ